LPDSISNDKESSTAQEKKETKYGQENGEKEGNEKKNGTENPG
jgi:hypothetical protein